MACTVSCYPLCGHCRQRLLQHPLRRAAWPGGFRHPGGLSHHRLPAEHCAGRVVCSGLPLGRGRRGHRHHHLPDRLRRPVPDPHVLYAGRALGEAGLPVAQGPVLKAAHPLGAAQRPDPGHLLLCHDYPPVPDKLLRHGGYRGQHRCDARGRLRHDAQLHLWHHHDHLHRPEHRRRPHRPGGEGREGRLENRPERLRWCWWPSSCCSAST